MINLLVRVMQQLREMIPPEADLASAYASGSDEECLFVLRRDSNAILESVRLEAKYYRALASRKGVQPPNPRMPFHKFHLHVSRPGGTVCYITPYPEHQKNPLRFGAQPVSPSRLAYLKEWVVGIRSLILTSTLHTDMNRTTHTMCDGPIHNMTVQRYAQDGEQGS